MNNEDRQHMIVPMTEEAVRELLIGQELIGTGTDLVPAANGISGARLGMEGTHLPQSTQIVGCEIPAIMTGAELEYSKSTFAIVAAHDCVVSKIIERYPAHNSSNGEPLERAIFVQIMEDNILTNRYDVIVIPKYCRNHQYFGFDYVLTEDGKRIRQYKPIYKGTVLADTAANINGVFCAGLNLNTAIVSSTDGIEDAIVISESAAKKMMSYGYKTYDISIGGGDIPLLPYGTAENPRMHPDVGERVRDDGILMATRKYDPLLAPVEMSMSALMNICSHYDRAINAVPGAEVIDVRVFRGSDDNDGKPADMTQEMCNRHAEATEYYYEQIRNFYIELKYEQRHGRGAGGKLEFTPYATQLIEQAIAMNPTVFNKYERSNDKKTRFNKVCKQFGYEVLIDYRVEVTIRYEIPLDEASKVTDLNAGKGIVAVIRPDEDMYVDDFGNRADIVVAANAVPRRTILARPFTQYINAARRDVVIRANEMIDDGREEEAVEYVRDFMNTVSPVSLFMYDRSHRTTKAWVDLLRECRQQDKNRLIIHFPIDYDRRLDDIEEAVMNRFPPNRSRLTYRGPDGKFVKTEEEIIIGEVYHIRLDKTGKDMCSIAAAKFQPFGTIAKQHTHDMVLRPYRERGIKFTGESEARHQAAYCKPGILAEHHDRANNPMVASMVIRNILKAENPMNIPSAVDREEFPLGENRVMAIVRHMDECDGCEFTIEDKQD